MFENPRRGRLARNFTTNVPKILDLKSFSEQIFSENRRWVPLAYLRGGNLRFKIDWSSCIVGSKLTIFALFYFVFGGNFPSTSPPGAYIWRGDNNGGSSALLDWGVYTWRGLFSEFYGTLFSTFYFQVSDFVKGFPNKVLRTIDLLNLSRDKMWK